MNSPEIPWDESDNKFEKSQKSPKNDKKRVWDALQDIF